jgi:hypothetical protein
MNIVGHLRASKYIRTMLMTRGFGCCSSASGKPLLPNILGGVSNKTCSRLNCIQMPNTGSLS